jgi:hypothetical protein
MLKSKEIVDEAKVEIFQSIELINTDRLDSNERLDNLANTLELFKKESN